MGATRRVMPTVAHAGPCPATGRFTDRDGSEIFARRPWRYARVRRGTNAAIFTAASSASSSATTAYTSAVKDSDAWPRISETTFIETPAA